MNYNNEGRDSEDCRMASVDAISNPNFWVLVVLMFTILVVSGI